MRVSSQFTDFSRASERGNATKSRRYPPLRLVDGPRSISNRRFTAELRSRFLGEFNEALNTQIIRFPERYRSAMASGRPANSLLLAVVRARTRQQTPSARFPRPPTRSSAILSHPHPKLEQVSPHALAVLHHSPPITPPHRITTVPLVLCDTPRCIRTRANGFTFKFEPSTRQQLPPHSPHQL